MTEPRVLTMTVASDDAPEVRKMRQAQRDGTIYHMTYMVGRTDFESFPVRVTRVRKQYRRPAVTVTMTEQREID